MKVCGFIPAKSTSSRLPSKNFLSIGGLPLFLNAAYNLNKCLDKEQIFIDTDSKYFIELAKDHGFSVLKRPKEYAKNSCDGNGLLEREIEETNCDFAIQHLPTMPFLRKMTLEQILAAITSGEFDSVLAYYREKLYLWEDEGPLYDAKKIPNSVDLPNTMIESMGIYAVVAEYFKKEKTRVGGKTFNIEINRWEQIDINEKKDYDFARSIYDKFTDY